MDEIREATHGIIPGAEITVDQESGGPPTPKPISVEIRGDDFAQLIDHVLPVVLKVRAPARLV
jgi:hypothetical protein